MTEAAITGFYMITASAMKGLTWTNSRYRQKFPANILDKYDSDKKHYWLGTSDYY